MIVPKKVLSALLAGMLLLTAAGCGERSSSSAETGSSTANASSAAETGSAPAPASAPAVTTAAYDTEWVPADPSLHMESLALGWTTDEMVKRSVLRQGNRARLANVMKKAQKGEPVTFGVIGGSITQGTGASGSEENYAYRTMAWWARSFQDSHPNVQFVNAGIGATGSYIGVHRAERDLLSKQPDVVIVEFSVNDTDPSLNLQSYDSLVRRILRQPNNPAVILLFMTQDNGTSLVNTHRKIGDAYDLPMISYKNAVLPEIDAGKFTWKDISPDNIHPNSNGHGIAAELLWNYFNSVLADLDHIDTSDLSFSAAAVSEDRYQNAQILDSETMTPKACTGFAPAEIRKDFAHNWKTETAGEITFEVSAANIGILYQRTIDGKSGQYDVYVDGEFKKTLNGHFGNGWGNYAEAAEVYTSESGMPHTITIKKSESSTADGFLLLGLLVS